ncbi:uncharacterized protein DEA37_0007505 [Paragonimus westermani]|uniref:Uncharacterized protein n=1 Tax=Paragonimus westermani TaxID=34504 RepID=A0A5J4NI90_9TREM|nr:uncharacterized protein DEA37_0007505 [Paragonimus westermani]
MLCGIRLQLYEKRGLCAQHIADFSIPPPEIDEDTATQRAHQPSTSPPGLSAVKKSTHYLKFCIPNEKSVKHVQAGNLDKQSSGTVGAPCVAMLEALDGSGEKLTVLTVNGTLVASATWTTRGTGLEISRALRGSNIWRVGSNEDVRKTSVFANLATLYGAGAGEGPLALTTTDVSIAEDSVKPDPNNPAKTQMLDLSIVLRYLTTLRRLFHLKKVSLMNIKHKFQTAIRLYGTQPAFGDKFVNKLQRTLFNQNVMQSTRAAGVNYFRLDHLLREFQLCSDADLDNCRRLRLLQLRNAGVAQFQNLIIPTSAKFIPSDILEVMLPAEGPFGERFITVPKFVISIFRQLFQARRPLRAVHQQRRRMAPQNLRESGLEIRVIIYAAHNLPARQPNVVGQVDGGSLSRLQIEVEGQIPIKVPLILLGYEVPDPLKSSTKPMIHLFITLEPQVTPADPVITKFVAVESREVLTQISEWQERVKKQKFFEERQFNPMVLNPDCKEVMVTRYLNPLNPPEDILPGSNPTITRLESMVRLPHLNCYSPQKK